MTITNKDKKLLVYLAAFAIIAVAYFFVYSPYMEKYEAISAECETLQTRLDHLNEIYVNKEQYENRIVDAELKYNEIVSKFYGGLDQDRTLMLIDHLENSTNMWISRVSFNEPELLAGDGYVPEENGGDGETVAPTSLAVTKQSLNIDYSGKYADFKKFIEYVNNFDKRLFISSMSAGYSAEANEVSGSIVISQYAINSQDKELETPDLSSVGTGVENIFTTLTGEGNVAETENGLTVQSLELNEGETPEEGSVSEENSSSEDAENSDQTSDNNAEESETPEQNDDDTSDKKPKTGGIL